MSHSYPIYNKVTREQKHPLGTRVAFGARESFEQTILVGTSAKNSHELGVISVERRELPDGDVEFALYLDNVLLRRGILDGKTLSIEDTAGIEDDTTLAALGYRADDNAEACTMKQIFLGQVSGPLERSPKFYRVKKLVNSMRYDIGDKLSADGVADLCDDAQWKVTITDGTL